MGLYTPPATVTALVTPPQFPNLALAFRTGTIPLPLSPATRDELRDFAKSRVTASQGRAIRKWVRRVKYADSRARADSDKLIRQLQQPRVAASLRAALGIDALAQRVGVLAQKTDALTEQMGKLVDWADIDRQRRLNRTRMRVGGRVAALQRPNRPFPADAGPAPRFEPDVDAMPADTVDVWLEYYAIIVAPYAGLGEKRDALVAFISLT